MSAHSGILNSAETVQLAVEGDVPAKSRDLFQLYEYQAEQWQKSCFVGSFVFTLNNDSSCTQGRILTFCPVSSFFIFMQLPSMYIKYIK